MSITITDILKFRETENDPWQRLLLQANINFNLIYPVGSIYMSTANVDPGTIFGGTWEQLKDTFLLGAGDNYTAGDTGGEATHTLTENEMPSHRHNLHDVGSAGTGTSTYGGVRLNQVFASNFTNYVGGGQAHNNMPPYIVVYMWKRLTLSPSLTPLPMNVLGDVASEDIVPIAKGGTGAATAAGARTNLDLETVDLSSSVSSIYSGYAIKLLKCGDIVSISIRTSSASISGSNSWVTLCNIPESVRPSNPIDTMGVNNSASNAQSLPLQFRVNTNGNIAVYLYSSTTTRPMGEITFNLKT
jgi:hypothetical protein